MPGGVSLTTQPEQVSASTLRGKAEGLVATMIRYEDAPLMLLQIKVGVVNWPELPLGGELKLGGGRLVTGAAVVKLN